MSQTHEQSPSTVPDDAFLFSFHPHIRLRGLYPRRARRLWDLSSRLLCCSYGLLWSRWLHLGSNFGGNSTGVDYCLQFCLWSLSGCLCGCAASPDALEEIYLAMVRWI